MRVRAALLAAGLAAAALAGCSDDDDGPPPADPLPEQSELPGHGGTEEADPGGLDVPEIAGTTFAPFPSLGFGIAVPQGWNATRLDDEALAELEDVRLAEPFFLDAARNVAATGAVFYAAGVDDQGRVAEIKVDVEEGANVDAVRTAAEAEVLAAGGTDVNVVEADDGRVRVDFRLAQPSAEDGETIDTHVSRLLVPDDDRLWSIVVTSEDAETQNAVLTIVDAGFVLAD
jgi:hypothetical protein